LGISLVDIFQRYGLDEKEVLAWAEATLPKSALKLSKNVVAQLYLKRVKGIVVDTVSAVTGVERKIADLQPGEWCVIKGLVGLKVKENVYIGCPDCFTSLQATKDRPAKEMCEIHLKPGVQLKFTSYIIGDDTGDVMISFPPRFSSLENLEGCIIKAKGFLSDQGEFVVRNYEVVEEKKAEPSKVEPQPQITPKEVEVSKPTTSSEQPSISAAASPEEIKVEAKPPAIDPSELPKIEMIKNWIQRCGFIPAKDLGEIHKKSKMKSSLEDILKAINAEVKGDKVVFRS
jgi:hypothetical protein